MQGLTRRTPLQYRKRKAGERMKSEETIEKDQNRQMPGVKKKKKSIKTGSILLLFAVVVLLATTGGLAFLVYSQSARQSKFEEDRNALEGFLPGKSEAEIQKELNRIIDESRLNISMNPTPVIRDGKINVMLENVPANNYYLQADVYIYTDEETLDMQQVYQSGIIEQGFYIESGDVMEIPEGGRYNGIAVFHALYPETLEEIGQAAMNIVVTSE